MFVFLLLFLVFIVVMNDKCWVFLVCFFFVMFYCVYVKYFLVFECDEIIDVYILVICMFLG